jgi:DNA-binding Lrp family transcriptional regulator
MKDPALRSVSFAARGLWMDMLCLIHEVNQNGKLVLKNGLPIGKAQLARMVGGSEKEVGDLLTELESSGVLSRDEKGVIVSRRMERDQALRQMRREFGKLGGNPNLVKQNTTTEDKQNLTPSSSSSISSSEVKPLRVAFVKPSMDELKLNAAKIGLPESEAEKFFHYYESNGWRVGRNPMKSWQSAMINWRKNYQQNGTNQSISRRGNDRNSGTYNAHNSPNDIQSKIRTVA